MMQNLVFSLNIRVLALAVILLPILLWLGNWQLHRAEEKEEIQKLYAERLSQAPVDFEKIDDSSDLSHLKVRLQGVYDNEHWLLLDNRVYNGQVGYEVLMPFLLDSGKWVLINRGWIKAPPLRSESPEVPEVSQERIELIGQIYVSNTGYQLDDPDIKTNQWPKVITAVDSKAIDSLLNRDLFPYQIRLMAEQPTALTIDWPPINVSPEKHRAYAVQWFAMSAGLIIWLIIASFSSRNKS